MAAKRPHAEVESEEDEDLDATIKRRVRRVIKPNGDGDSEASYEITDDEEVKAPVSKNKVEETKVVSKQAAPQQKSQVEQFLSKGAMLPKARPAEEVNRRRSARGRAGKTRKSYNDSDSDEDDSDEFDIDDEEESDADMEDLEDEDDLMSDDGGRGQKKGATKKAKGKGTAVVAESTTRNKPVGPSAAAGSRRTRSSGVTFKEDDEEEEEEEKQSRRPLPDLVSGGNKEP